MLSSLVPLAALVSLSLAASNLDFSAEFRAVTSASVTPTSGDYLVQNVATGQYLYFARDGQVGAYLGSVKTGVHIEERTYRGVTGVIIKGTSSDTLKCLASQWNFDGNFVDFKLAKRARNEFAVPYACRLGSDGTGTYDDDPNGNDSNKQFWLLNPVGDATDTTDADDSGVAATVAVNLNALSTKQTEDKAVAFDEPKAESTSPAKAPAKETAAVAPAATKQAVDKNDQTTWDCKHDGVWLARHEKDYIVTLGHVECISVLAAYKATLASAPASSAPVVDSQDQSTWVCQHDGKWLARHEQNYIVTLGHIECIPVLAAYKANSRKMAKRSRQQLHAAVARRSVQERALKTYFTIHPINHLDDMQTLALSGKTGKGFADMPAVILAFADDNDKSQWWRMVAM